MRMYIVCVCSSLVRFFVILVSFEKLKSDYNQTWVNDAIGIPSMLMRSKVMYQGQGSSRSSRWKRLVFVIWVSFEKLKSDWNQTWV